MNQAHLHLLTNHLPILGSAFGLLVLVLASASRAHAQAVRNAAYVLFVVSAIGAVIANWTGEGAEELVEEQAGVTHESIEAHEDAAPYALGAALAAGVLALAGLAAAAIRPAWNGRMALAVGLVALFAFATSARTGWLGGKIRHPEAHTGH